MDPGYIIVPAKSPSDTLFEALEANISNRGLASFRYSSDDRRAVRALEGKDADESRLYGEILHYGVDIFQQNSFFREIVGISYADARKTGPKLVFWVSNPRRLDSVIAGPPRTAYIYRNASRNRLGPENGLFRIVPGSHKMTAGEVERHDSIPIYLEPTQLLIMSASLTIEYPETGGGLGLFEAVMPAARHP